MKRLMVTLISVLIVVLLCSERISAQTWGVVEDFQTSNPNGVWEYGYTVGVGGSFNYAQNGMAAWYFGVPGWQCGSSGALIYAGIGVNKTANELFDGNFSYLQPHQAWVQPAWNGNPQTYRTVVRWIAPANGEYQIYVEFTGISSFTGNGDYGTTTDVHVVLNGTSVWDEDINGFAGSDTLAPQGTDYIEVFSQILTLQAGDTIDAVVGDGVNQGGDMTGLRFTVQSAAYQADFNRDCRVNGQDLEILTSNWLLGVDADPPCTGDLSMCGGLTLSPQGEASPLTPYYPSGSLAFTGSSWDSGSGSAIDLSCTMRLRALGGYGYAFDMLDAFGYPAMMFLDNEGPGKEFYFQNNEAGGSLVFNLRNERPEEIGLKFSMADFSNDWMLCVPGGVGNNMFSILREDLFTAMLLDEEGRMLIGYLNPDPASNAPVKARLEIRGLLDEPQLLVTGSSGQSVPIVKVCASDNSIQYLNISSTGKMWLGYSSTPGVVPSNILTVQQNSPTDPIADAWTVYSSRRWKKDIEPIKDALDKVQQLRGVSFDWKADGKHDIGLIAEEVGQVVPEVVAYEENGTDAKSVDYARLVAVLVEAVKQQQKEFEKQQTEIDRLLFIAESKKFLENTEEKAITLPASQQLLINN